VCRSACVGASSVTRSPAILAYVVGDPATRRRILLVGCVHGDERQGEVITRRLRTETPPTGTVWWLIDQANPDGCRAGRRQNGHGVDLNRNSPWHRRRLDAPGGVHYAGPRPLSEPESRAVNRLVRRLRPTVSVWYHQHAALVDTSSGGQIALERHYAAESGLPLRAYGRVPGSITTWQDTRLARSTAFVVELPAGRLSPAAIVRHLKAVRSLSPTRRSALRDPSSAGGQAGSSRIRPRSRG